MWLQPAEEGGREVRDLLGAPVTPPGVALRDKGTGEQRRGEWCEKWWRNKKETKDAEVEGQSAPVALHHLRIVCRISFSPLFYSTSFWSFYPPSISYISLPCACSPLLVSILLSPFFFPFQLLSQLSSAQPRLPITLQPLYIFDFVGY